MNYEVPFTCIGGCGSGTGYFIILAIVLFSSMMGAVIYAILLKLIKKEGIEEL